MKTKEFTQRDNDRIDDVYNAVYDCIVSVTGKSSEDIPFDRATIDIITENLIKSVLDCKIVDKVYFPHLEYDGHNEHHVEKYYTDDSF